MKPRFYILSGLLAALVATASISVRKSPESLPVSHHARAGQAATAESSTVSAAALRGTDSGSTQEINHRLSPRRQPAPSSSLSDFSDSPSPRDPSPSISSTQRNSNKNQHEVPAHRQEAFSSDSASHHSISPDVLIASGQRLEIVSHEATDAGLDFEIEIRPAPLSTARASVPGLTLEEELFRAKWGWAAYDQMQRLAATEVSSRED